MSGATESRRNGNAEESPTLRAALAMLRVGLRPVPLYPGKKKPIGEEWGLKTHTEASLRAEWACWPGAGLGWLLGHNPDGVGVIDIEVDDEELAKEALGRMFPAGIPPTLHFRANTGPHHFFLYSPRLAKYKQTIIKGWEEKGEIRGNPHYLGLEIRIGTIDPASRVQEHSVIPPTSRDDGSSRQWMGAGDTLLHPEAVFDDLSRLLEIPESVFADLDRFARPLKVEETKTEPTWDAEEVKRAILPHARSLALEWGLRITGKRPSPKGFLECRAIGREDNHPSAGFNETTGVYHDKRGDVSLSIFQLAVALGQFTDFPTAVNSLGRRFGVAASTFVNSGSSADATYVPSEPQEWGNIGLFEPLPAEPFPLDVFPPSLAQLCLEARRAMHCPSDYHAAAALGLAGAVIGRSVALSVTSSWEIAPNLFIAIVGPPGTKKSPALKLMASPLWKIDRELRDLYREEVVQFKAAAKRGEEPDPPIPLQLTLDDATREAFAAVHAENLRGLVLVKDELTAWVASLNAYRQGKGDDKQFWMSLNSGALVKVNRKGSREPIVIPHPCASVVGCLTPGMLPAMRDSRADDGWIDRILFAYPIPDGGGHRWTRDEISRDCLDDWAAAIRYLWSRQMVVEDGHARPFFVRLTPQAEPLWEEFYNAHNAEQHDPEFPASLVGPWSKLEGFALRIALVLSQLRQAYDPEPGNRPRDLDALDIWDARKLINYFKSHFRRARADLSGRHEIPEEADAILRWIRRRSLASFSGRDLSRQFTRFLDPDRDFAIDWLIARHVIREVPSQPRPAGKKGRPHSAVFEVNPNLRNVSKNDTNDRNARKEA